MNIECLEYFLLRNVSRTKLFVRPHIAVKQNICSKMEGETYSYRFNDVNPFYIITIFHHQSAIPINTVNISLGTVLIVSL